MNPHIYFKHGIWNHKNGDWRTLKGSIANHLAFEWCAKQNAKILFLDVQVYLEEDLLNQG